MDPLTNGHAQPARGPLTVAALVEDYLKLGTKDLAADGLDNIRRTMRLFVADFGPRLVTDMRAIDLQRWLAEHPTWKSTWTVKRALLTVKRVWNWGLDMELVDRNPFERVRVKGRTRRHRPMRDEEFQALLRFTDPNFRRFLVFLKFTGCRPKEASTMRWRDVHFDKRAVILQEHKTAAATGKPRIIPLIPCTIKLLVWLKSHRQASVIGLVERFLVSNGGRLKICELARLMRPYGVSQRGVRRARLALGVTKEWIKTSATTGYYEYVLPDDHEPLPDPKQGDFVFVTCLGTAFDKHNLSHKFRRLRDRAGLPKTCTLYGLRHRYGLMGIKNKVNLKLLSLCMGHADVRMTERYINEEGLAEDVQLAALQVAYGQAAVWAIAPPPPPRPVVMLEPPAVAEIQAMAEHLPDHWGNTRRRPQVPIVAPPEPIAVDAQKLDTVLNGLLHRLAKPEPSRSRKSAVIPRQLNPAHEIAWKGYRWALEHNPELAKAKDPVVYAWLAAQPDCPVKLPALPTWLHYVSVNRLYHDCRKRLLRPRVPMPEPPAEEDVA